jgi:hypothetical protein
MTDGGGDQSDLVLASTNGPAWVGEPPYPEPDYVNMQSDVPAPSLRCKTSTGTYANPSWSSDSRTVAYGGGDGVHVLTVPADFDCSKLGDRLLVPGGSDPAFGPADVNMAQQPAPSDQPPHAQPGPHPGTHTGGAVALRGLSIAPRKFRPTPAGRSIARRAGALVRFTLNRAARVTLTVSRRRPLPGRIVVSAQSGVNSIRFSGWLSGHKLAPGRYRLAATGGRSSSSTSFVVTR